MASLLFASALAGAGMLLNSGGPPEKDTPPSVNSIPENMKPSGNDVYDSHRWRQVRDIEQKEADDMFIKGFDTTMTNIVPTNYNQIWSPSSKVQNPERTTLPSEHIREDIARKRAIMAANETKIAAANASDSAFVAITSLPQMQEGFPTAKASYTIHNAGAEGQGPYPETNPQSIAQKTGSQPLYDSWKVANSVSATQYAALPGNDPNGHPSGVIGIPSIPGSSGMLSAQFRPEDYEKFGVVGPNENPKMQKHGVIRQNTDTFGSRHFQISSSASSAARDREGFNPTITGPQKNPEPYTHNNMVPFFGAHRTQNIHRPHDEKLEMFTGSLPSSTQFRMVHKKELARDDMFKPVFGLTHPYGTPNLGNYGRDRYITSQKKENVKPVPEIRVGRGLNQPGYGAAPADGFHSKYRPPQYNVDDLRPLSNPKLTYRGRVLRGKEDEGRRGYIGKTYKRNPDRFYVNSQDRYFTTAVADAIKPKMERPENYLHAFEETQRDTTTQSYGGIMGPTGRDAQTSYAAEYNMQAPLRHSFKQIGPSGVNTEGRAGEAFDYGRSGQYGVGRGVHDGTPGCNSTTNPTDDAYHIDSGASYGNEIISTPSAMSDADRIYTEEGFWARPQERGTTEEVLGTHRIGLGTKQNEEYTMRPFDRARTTKVETLPFWARETSGASTKQNERAVMRPFDRARTTKVETLPFWAREASGASTKQNERFVMRPFDRARTTKVETLPFWAREASGPSALDGIGNPRDRTDAENMEHTGEREMVLRERRPTKQSVKNTIGMEGVHISMRQRDMVDEMARHMTAGANPGDKQWQPIPDKWQQGRQDKTMNKVQSESIRQPEDFLVQEHRKNPYTKPLDSVAAY